jgi:sortase A
MRLALLPRSKIPERVLFAVGIALLAFFAVARLSSAFLRARDVRRFNVAAAVTTPAERRAENAPVRADAPVRPDAPNPDTSLWSPERKKAYEASQAAPGGIPLAVLAIPRFRLEVPVLEGTDELTLNRALGLIEGTARPGGRGNVGIAGHRDGFFRCLKDIAPGDMITLRAPAGNRDYVVKSVRVVEPDDVSVLDDAPRDVLTLVTCYPFYYVGSAPQRFIVRAE